jgi:hypothetical protein
MMVLLNVGENAEKLAQFQSGSVKLYSHCDQISDINSVREGRLILVQGFRGFSPSWQGKHDREERLTS